MPAVTGFSAQRRIVVAVFAALCLALGAGYYLFLRTDYAVLYTGLKPSDASAIVAELKAKGIAHRLRDDGTTILVPVAQADDVRLSVAGSDIPMKGAVGFELFNKSDMGLTDFAQKINYQRALQGELARTIMMMEGIESARVHLAIPERSLFRGNRGTAKAAVEVQSRLGHMLTPARVAGIQQLIASSVPDLPLGEVAVLDSDGQIVSQALQPSAQTPEIEEQTAAQNYYSARARTAMSGVLPGLGVDVRTLALGADDGTAVAAGAAPGARNFRLRVTVLTLAPLNGEDQQIARNAVATAIGLNEAAGDTLSFEVGPIAAPQTTMLPTSPAPALPAAGPASDDGLGTMGQPRATGAVGIISWWSIALATLAMGIAALLLLRARSPTLSAEHRDAFVGRLRAHLGTPHDTGRSDDGR